MSIEELRSDLKSHENVSKKIYSFFDNDDIEQSLQTVQKALNDCENKYCNFSNEGYLSTFVKKTAGTLTGNSRERGEDIARCKEELEQLKFTLNNPEIESFNINDTKEKLMLIIKKHLSYGNWESTSANTYFLSNLIKLIYEIDINCQESDQALFCNLEQINNILLDLMPKENTQENTHEQPQLAEQNIRDTNIPNQTSSQTTEKILNETLSGLKQREKQPKINLKNRTKQNRNSFLSGFSEYVTLKNSLYAAGTIAAAGAAVYAYKNKFKNS